MKHRPSHDISSLIIRSCTEKDLPQILAIESQAFKDPWSLRAFSSELEAPQGQTQFWVACTEVSEILGYVVFQMVLDEIYIKKLAVHPLKRRCKLGSAFLSSILKFARDHKVVKISLDCDEENHVARSFYRANGFIETSPRGRSGKIVFVKHV